MKLEAKNLSKSFYFRKHFYLKQEEKKLFENLSFSLSLGENLLIQGESGSGKSSLAKILCMLEKPSSGEVLLDGLNLFSLNEKEQREQRKKIQYVFSDVKLALNPYKKISTLINEVFDNFNLKRDEKLVDELCLELELDKKLFNLKPQALSGGEAARIALLRALLVKANFLILDEVFASLDSFKAEALARFLQKLQAKTELSFIFISHQDKFIRDFSPKILNLESFKPL